MLRWAAVIFLFTLARVVTAWGAMNHAITVALSRRDHRAALVLMAEAWSVDLGRFCAILVGSRAEAEELLQEAFIEAWAALPRLRKPEQARSWMFGIVRRVCSQHLRRRDRRAALRERYGPLTLVSATATDPGERADTAARLEAALHDLPRALREAVLLRYQADLSGPEIARALGIRPATARKRVSLALSALREALRPLLEDDPQPARRREA